ARQRQQMHPLLVKCIRFRVLALSILNPNIDNFEQNVYPFIPGGITLAAIRMPPQTITYL
ncbi:hypothetical protein HK102_006346, partial [Quaeritorhiza haematococci]